MAKLELYGTASCPYTREMRDWLEWKETEFTEYDIDADESACERMKGMTEPPYTVPVLVEDGEIVQVGWQGRGCIVDNRGAAKKYAM